ncbi:MAG: tRNA uridine-5-carboxymethylaminomethyl(34) synthesis GTPase MnmE [Lachnospiraceae bacterium]|nr:tRNA uridine-5-carboxymethylaminomethyl(34) synthesis GTPase MnmE [Lachnospiraceae bacterium]
METNTIAAISTALSEGGIGIIRLSGDDALNIVNSIFVNKDKKQNLLSFKSHTIHYGFIVSGDEIVDEVMVSIMKAPNSFTKEDVVEINCHGGILVCKKILELVLNNGAKLAEPGEFTKRAFLNGRIDLSKAEAVMDVISSKNNQALKNSLMHLEGKLFEKIKDIREGILYEIAFIESALDDPEHISLDGYNEKLSEKLSYLINEVSKLYDSSKKGKFLKEGINTVILGKPNVGKSSLLNVLSGYEKAIVTDVAGTTRDIIEEEVVLNDISLNLIDTAGIRETDDYVENIGVSRAKKYADSADLILFIMDATKDISKEDEEIIDLIKDKKTIVLLNKIDADCVLSKEKVSKLFSKECDILEISAKESLGIKDLENIIENMFLEGRLPSNDELYITNIRQGEEIKNALTSLNNVEDSIEKGLPEDFYSIDLMSAYASLGKIIGEQVDDDLVDEIFSKFCMGK